MNSIIGIIFGKKNTPWQRIDAEGNSIGGQRLSKTITEFIAKHRRKMP